MTDLSERNYVCKILALNSLLCKNCYLALRGVKFHRAKFFRKNSITNLDYKIHRKIPSFCYEILSFFDTNFIACHVISSPKFRFRNSLNLWSCSTTCRKICLLNYRRFCTTKFCFRADVNRGIKLHETTYNPASRHISSLTCESSRCELG